MRVKTWAAAISSAALVAGLLAVAPVASANEGTPTPVAVAQLEMQAPGGLGILPENGRIVVTGFNDGIAQVVDSASWSIVGSIPTEVPAASLVQMLPETGRAYLVGREPIVSVIDVNNVTMPTQIPLNQDDVNATDTLIYQADVPLLFISFAPGALPGAVALVSTVTNFRRITAGFPYETGGMAIPKDALVLLMSYPGAGSVQFLDTSFVPFEEVAVGGAPGQILTSSDGTLAYVANPVSGRIDVIDTRRAVLVGSIDVGVGVTDFALSPNGLGLTALIPESGEIVNVDLRTASVVSRGPIGVEPVALVYGTDDRVVYVADRGGNSLLAVDLLHELPGAPTDVRVKVGDKKARVSWRAPESQGTAPIVRYRVTALPEAGSCTTRKRTCTIQGLKPGKSYRFQVVAETEVTSSDPAVSKPAKIPRD